MAQQVLTPPPAVRRPSRTIRYAVLVTVVVLGIAAAVVALLALRRTGEEPIASATLRLADGRSIGRVDFFDAPPGTKVRVQVDLPPGIGGRAAFHGFHLHANDDAINGNGCLGRATEPSKTWFTSADAHLDHAGHKHSDHGGDMPSVYVTNDGHGYLEFGTDRLSIADLTDRAVMLHAGPDNFGRVPVGNTPTDYTPNSPEAIKATQTGGNSGDRIACGLVGAPVTD